MTTVTDLTDEAAAIAAAIDVFGPGTRVRGTTDIGTHAIYYALRGWEVFPLRGKVPAIAGGRGVLDATADVDQIVAWWSGRYAGANIGLRVPANVIVLDIDPRSGGLAAVIALQAEHGRLPATMGSQSGRGDGGGHRYFRRPAGDITAARLPEGIDLKTHAGYVVAPPSLHPDTGKPYTWLDIAEVADPPRWLIDLLRPAPRPPRQCSSSGGARHRPGDNDLTAWSPGSSPADGYTASTTWAQVLEPHGWRCLDADGDADGARWLHPNATSQCSATVRNDCLFVYSPNTPLPVTEPGNPNGCTKFRAYAHLNHNGDMSAAARTIKEMI